MVKLDQQIILYVVVGIAAWVAYKKGLLNNILPGLGGGGGGGSPNTPGGGNSGGGPLPSGEMDDNGVQLPYATTGNFVDMEEGSAHENGQRYNVNHKFADHMIIGYFLTKSGQEAIGVKTDGPNHGGCSSSPECRWIDPDLGMNCNVKYGAEYPHPDANDLDCPSCKSCGQDLSGKWVGIASLVYGPPGDRWHEFWVDPGGLDASEKPANQWQQLLKENYTKQIPSNWQRTEHPVNFDNGFEAEIRMRGAQGTDMKYSRVYELNTGGGGSTAATARVRSYNVQQQDYLYNNRIVLSSNSIYDLG
jgi:hypothetical protein